MPLLMLWGHGSFRTPYGYFRVPANVRIEFFVPDNSTIDDDSISVFERGDLRQGVSDALVTKAAKRQNTVARITKNQGDVVKNYRLETILGDFLAPNAKNALKNSNVWTPGKGTKKTDAESSLLVIVGKHAHKGKANDPLVLQWCACTSNYAGNEEDESPIAVDAGLEVDVPARRGCCYISTATCEALGLPDDCEPLNKLRAFRDHVLRTHPRGRADVAEYYGTAPAIVRAINQLPASRQVYRAIFDDHLSHALAAIDARDTDGAHAIYERMVADLKRRHLRD
jgi:hypothetical protein